jgi:phenylacetate-CoA ligase
MFWNKEIECIDEEKLREKQLERLKNTIKRAYEKVPYYRKKLNEAQVSR